MARTKIPVRFNGKIAKEILLGLAGLGAAASLTILLAAAPGFGLFLKEILMWYESADRRKQFQTRKTFKQLIKNRLVDLKHLPGGKARIILSEEGKKRVLEYEIDKIKILQPTKWDGLWRFVIFDLPNKFKRERELWRTKLKNLGFYQLQRSIWVHPYSCRNEIDFISEYFTLRPHIRILEVKSFDGERDLHKFFNL